MDLLTKIKIKKVKVGVIGLGYVGLPLVIAFAKNNIKVIGFDIDQSKVENLNAGKSYIRHISHSAIEGALSSNFKATTDFSLLNDLDAIIICVPTPLGTHREPDLQYVTDTSKVISQYLKKDQIVILVSTTYPGTTEEVVLPILEKSGLEAGKDFYLAYSPEREDPGNNQFKLHNVPKVVGGYSRECLRVASYLFKKIKINTVEVNSLKVAEATKLLENIYRAVNIALVNELKIILGKMGIDIFEVIEAAKTKPYGFSAFYPGPGLGGHCIPIDPFYLTWKAREYDYSTRFIELAGEINSFMPYYVMDKVIEALDDKGRNLKGSKILLLGMSYKKNVDDMRESPSLKLMDILLEKGAKVNYHDPYIPELPKTRKYNFERKSIELTVKRLKSYDCIIVSADHDQYDKEMILRNANIIVDTRNLFKISGLKSGNIYKA